MKKFASWFSRKNPDNTESLDRKKVSLALLIPGVLIATIIPAFVSGKGFDDLYEKYITHEITLLQSLGEHLGALRHEEITGNARLSLDLPVVMSGNLNFNYTSKIDGRNGSLSLTNLLFAFESMVSTGSLAADEIRLLSRSGDAYILYKNIRDTGIFPEELAKVLSSYNEKWLSWTKEDARRSMTGMTEDEKFSLLLTQNLSLLSLADWQEYLTDYPLLKEGADQGIVDGLHTWQVQLDKENLIALFAKLGTDLTQSSLSEEARKNLETTLDTLRIEGTAGFDPSDSGHAKITLTLKDASAKEILRLNLVSSGEKRDISIASPVQNTELRILIDAPKEQKNLTLTLSQTGTELARVTAKLDTPGEKLHTLSLDATVQGVTATLSHTNNDNGTFDGRLTLPVGALTWTGDSIDGRLHALSLRGTMPDASLVSTLVLSGGKLVGPISLSSEGQEAFRANLSLEKHEGKFAFSLEVPTTDNHVGASMYFDTEYTTKPFHGDIDAPASAEPLDTFFTALEKALPSDSFTEEVPQTPSTPSLQ